MLVSCAILATALNLRLAVTALSPLLRSIGGELHFGLATVSLFAMLPPATFAVAAMLGGIGLVLQRRRGSRSSVCRENGRLPALRDTLRRP